MALYRRTSNPGATCPEDLYSSEELARMDRAADLEEQIEAIDRNLMDLDAKMSGADNAGAIAELSRIESEYDELIELQSQLQQQLHDLFD